MHDDFPQATWIVEGSQPEVRSVAHDIPAQERATRPYRITTTWTYEAQPNGFPVAGGLDQIHKIEDRFVSQIAPIGALFVGHVFGAGRATVTCYARSTAESTISVRLGLLSKKVLEVTSHLDPDWAFYHNELEPSKMRITWNKYAQLVMTLEEHGDVAESPRPVDFNLDFPTQSKMQAALPALQTAGFALIEDGKLRGGGWGAMVQKVSPVTMEALYPEIELLETIANRHHGSFDGWACPVTK